MLVQRLKAGDYKANLYQFKLGYQYKIFYKLNGRSTCIARSYTFMHDKDKCYEKMVEELHVTMGIAKDLFG